MHEVVSEASIQFSYIGSMQQMRKGDLTFDECTVLVYQRKEDGQLRDLFGSVSAILPRV
jgi:hypothetical protein